MRAWRFQAEAMTCQRSREKSKAWSRTLSGSEGNLSKLGGQKGDKSNGMKQKYFSPKVQMHSRKYTTYSDPAECLSRPHL